MPKNDGTESQNLFRDAIESLGKQSYIYRFPDTREVKGALKGLAYSTPGVLGMLPKTPADFLVSAPPVLQGLHFAEVKSTWDKTSINFHETITKGQLTQAKWLDILKQGEHYNFFIHSLVLKKWFHFDAVQLFIWMDFHKYKSMKFSGMTQCLWLEKLIGEMRK